MNKPDTALTTPLGDQLDFSQPVRGEAIAIGTGFEATSFKHSGFAGLMDPIVMVDHFVMSLPTFGEHPHAGMSAVSVLFEDSTGVFNSKDSLGNNDDLLPGDLYWLKAGKGVTHDEKPLHGGTAHGLQIFVNLPSKSKQDAPVATHVSSSDIPVIESPLYRVRVVLGESNAVKGPHSPSLPLTILDATLNAEGLYNHAVSGLQAIWIYAATGNASFSIGEKSFDLSAGEAMAIHIDMEQTQLSLKSQSGAHIVVLQGEPIREQFVQRGPFVMSNCAELNAVEDAHKRGMLGSINSAQHCTTN